jgi:hypothetical protein
LVRNRVALISGAVLVAVLISALGIARHRSPLATADQAWWRYAKQLVQLGLMLAFFSETALWTRNAARWRRTLRWLAAGLAFQLVYSAWQALAFYVPNAAFAMLDRIATSNPAILAGSEELFLGAAMSGLPRLRGTAAEPLYLASYLLLVIPLVATGVATGDRGRRVRWVLLTLAGVLFVATWSRGAFAGWMIGWGAAAVLAGRAGVVRMPRRGVLVVAAGCAAVGLGIAVVAVGVETISLPLRRISQSFDAEDWSVLTRYFSMQAAWRGFLFSPLFGLGWGQFGFHFPLLVDPLGLQSQFTWPVVNNLPLLILCETGLVGAAVAATIAVAAGAAIARGTRPSVACGAVGSQRRLVALVAGNVGVGIQLLTYSQYNLPHIWVGWGLLAAALLSAETGDADAVPSGCGNRPVPASGGGGR